MGSVNRDSPARGRVRRYVYVGEFLWRRGIGRHRHEVAVLTRSQQHGGRQHGKIVAVPSPEVQHLNRPQQDFDDGALLERLKPCTCLFVVNKADRPGAERVVAELEEVLQLRSADGPPPAIVQTVAVNGEGIDALDAAIEAHRAANAASGAAARRRTAQREAKVRRIVEDRLATDLFDGKGIAARAAEAVAADPDAARSPYGIAADLLAEALAARDADNQKSGGAK